MAGLPLNFSLPSENLIASYDWTDVQAGISYFRFYGLNCWNGTASTNILSNQLIRSDSLVTDEKAGDAATNYWYFESAALDSPRTVAVNSAFILMYWTGRRSGLIGPGTFNLKVKLMKKRGVTYTDMSNEADTGSITVNNGASATATETIVLTTVKTSLAIGDIIVLKITLDFNESYHLAKVSHDPYEDTADTNLEVNIPFKTE